MRRSALLLVLAAAPALSGCTLGFGLLGAVQAESVARVRLREVETADLRRGMRVRIDRHTALPLIGSWDSIEATASVADTAHHAVVYCLIADAERTCVPSSDVNRVRRWPKMPHPAMLLTGVVFDATWVGVLLHWIGKSYENFGSNPNAP